MTVKELIEKLKTVDPDMEVHIEAPIASDYYETEYGEYGFSEKDIDTLCGVFTIGIGQGESVMTVKELIAVLSKYDDDLEVVNAVPDTAYDCDAYPEDITVGSIDEYDFEVDDRYKALVFKAAGGMPERRDWNNNYPHGVPWMEKV